MIGIRSYSSRFRNKNILFVLEGLFRIPIPRKNIHITKSKVVYFIVLLLYITITSIMIIYLLIIISPKLTGLQRN